MGMYLMRQAAGDGLPAFMSFLSWSELPWFWWGTQHFAWAMLLVVLVPGLLALVFGWFAFRSKIKGVYFSIMTQALTYAGMLLFFRNETGFGGKTVLPALPRCSVSPSPPSARGRRCLWPRYCCCCSPCGLAICWRKANWPRADGGARC
ncbi:Urea ABC transporter [Klebsiella michiganensis]|nr:Urea ABC transporter [Klebsiella michiganensis]